MDNENKSIETVEEEILQIGNLLTESTYEKFIDGELNQNEFQEINALLSEWVDNGKKLIEFVS